MDNIEAKWLLLRELVQWRRRPYADSVKIVNTTQYFESKAVTGNEYWLVFDLFWDGKRGGNIRVIGSIEKKNRGRARCCPLSHGVLISKPTDA